MMQPLLALPGKRRRRAWRSVSKTRALMRWCAWNPIAVRDQRDADSAEGQLAQRSGGIPLSEHKAAHRAYALPTILQIHTKERGDLG